MTDLDADALIKIRRDLHQIPELALHETRTHDYLMQLIKSCKRHG